eukprot:Em0010g673a
MTQRDAPCIAKHWRPWPDHNFRFGFWILAECLRAVFQHLDKAGLKLKLDKCHFAKGNGQVERFNRTLEGMLSKEIEEHQKDWDDHLQKVLFAYRTAVHTTGYTPYFIMSGRSPNLPIDILLGRAQTQGQELPDYVKKTSHLSSQHFLWFANDYMRLTEDKNKRRIKSPVERLFKLVIVFGFLFLRSKRDKPRNSLLCGGVNTQLLTNDPNLENANSHLPETTASATISEGDSSSGTDVGAMQGVAYQKQESVSDANEDDIIIPVEGATIENEDHVLDAENPPLDVRRNPPRNRRPPLRYVSVDYLSCEDARSWREELCEIIITLVSWSINTPAQV